MAYRSIVAADIYEAGLMRGEGIMKGWIGIDIGMEGIMAMIGHRRTRLSWIVTF